MLNLKDVTGVESSPISKSILENSLGNNNLKDSRAYANYEFILSSLQDGSFKAPSVIFASGNGTFYPKNTAYQGEFYSANILAREGYTNSWMTSYGIDENYNLSYYDGSTLFKSLSINPATGRGKIRSIEVRNGNLPGQAGFVQFLLGYNESASTNNVGKYRHNFRTRHSTLSKSENAIDLYLWDYINDSENDVGSRRVFSLYGTGSVEIVSGTQIFGPLNIVIETEEELDNEQSTLAIPRKGVIYYNKSKNRFRYSENGNAFKYFGTGNGGSNFESAPLVNCSTFRDLSSDIANPHAIGAYFFAKDPIEIMAVCTVIQLLDSMNISEIQFAIYKPNLYIQAGNDIAMIGSTNNRVMDLIDSGEIHIINARNVYSVGELETPVSVQGWFCVVLAASPNTEWPSIYATMNMSEMMSMADLEGRVPLQFIRDDIVVDNESNRLDMWPDTINSINANASGMINKNVIPYIKLEIA